MKRTLSLKRETLATLTNDEMATFAGAASLPNCIALASLDPLTTCLAIRESVLQCTGSGCNTWNSDCSCRI